jgi:hypothetical protein
MRIRLQRFFQERCVATENTVNFEPLLFAQIEIRFW